MQTMEYDDGRPSGYLAPDEGEYLRAHARLLGAKPNPRVLEIGSLSGRSASFILDGLAESAPKDQASAAPWEVWCVDPWKCEWENVASPQAVFTSYLLEHNMVDRVRLLHGTSAEMSPVFMRHNFGFAFVDGDHTGRGCMLDLLLCTHVTGCVILHDYMDDGSFPGVKAAVDWFIEQTPGWLFTRGPGRLARLTLPYFFVQHGLQPDKAAQFPAT